MKTYSRTLAPLVASLVVLAACGGGQETAASTADASAQATATESPAATRLAVSTAAATDTAAAATASDAANAAAAPAPRTVITAAMVRTVGAPPRPDNGVVVVHPGIQTRERAATARDSAGARSARIPNIGN